MPELRRHQKLPMDIIESEILPRLPAKSVGRFMCVCKQWQSLISTQDFHRKNHRYITTVDPRTHQKLLLLDAPAGSFCTLDCETTPTDITSCTTRSIPFGSDRHERFREIDFPCGVSGGRGFNGSLVVMNGCVHLCVAHQNIEREFYVPSVDIDLWRMDGDGDGVGWMKVVAYSGEKNIPFSLTPNCKVRHGKWDVTWVFNKALEKVDVTTDKDIPEVTYHEASLYDLVRAIYVDSRVAKSLIQPNIDYILYRIRCWKLS
ncbi:hypothetical protein L1987_49861 [Smallanthus sonchifolius]|uniref:Uncharacterized protein n=1 Tax=Smallanthus sonchifolius TaxID=185202 RepID=A0ACB9FVX0_9ASTR|nr:hypothetical protein L1987_49861 [Smallanthus sonchifolius]